MYLNDKLNRFIQAQENTYHIALNEIREGKKQSHWMWFIFPQVHGLGKSLISQKYSIKNYDEAKDFINHDILGSRLIEITKALVKLENKSAKQIFGTPDYLKLKSSLTLFNIISTRNLIFSNALDKYFKGNICDYTKNYFSDKK